MSGLALLQCYSDEDEITDDNNDLLANTAAVISKVEENLQDSANLSNENITPDVSFCIKYNVLN